MFPEYNFRLYIEKAKKLLFGRFLLHNVTRKIYIDKRYLYEKIQLSIEFLGRPLKVLSI